MISTFRHNSLFRFNLALVAFLICCSCGPVAQLAEAIVDAKFFLCEDADRQNCIQLVSAPLGNSGRYFSHADISYKFNKGKRIKSDGYFRSIELTCDTELTVVAFTGPDFDGTAFVNTCTPGTRLLVDGFFAGPIGPLPMSSLIISPTKYTLVDEDVNPFTVMNEKSLGFDMWELPEVLRTTINESIKKEMGLRSHHIDHVATRAFVGSWGQFGKNAEEIGKIGNATRKTILKEWGELGEKPWGRDSDEPVIVLQAALKIDGSWKELNCDTFVAIEFYIHPEIDSSEDDQIDFATWGITIQALKTSDYWLCPDKWIIKKVYDITKNLDFGKIIREKINKSVYDKMVGMGLLTGTSKEGKKEDEDFAAGMAKENLYSKVRRYSYAFPDPLSCNPLAGVDCPSSESPATPMVAVPPRLVIHRR